MPVLNLTFAKKKANGNGEIRALRFTLVHLAQQLHCFNTIFLFFGFLYIIKNRLSYASIIFLDFCTGFHGDKLSESKRGDGKISPGDGEL